MHRGRPTPARGRLLGRGSDRPGRLPSWMCARHAPARAAMVRRRLRAPRPTSTMPVPPMASAYGVAPAKGSPVCTVVAPATTLVPPPPDDDDPPAAAAVTGSGLTVNEVVPVDKPKSEAPTKVASMTSPLPTGAVAAVHDPTPLTSAVVHRTVIPVLNVTEPAGVAPVAVTV